MKGVIFIELIEMVGQVFSEAVADEMIDASDLASGGAYTAVGYYDHQEVVSLVSNLSRITGQSVPFLLGAFGEYLFARLASRHQDLISFADGTLSLLAGIENVIHPAVLKLYPDAELPHFDVLHRTTTQIELVYRSSRHFDDLACGLIRGCLSFYKEKADVTTHAFEQEGVLIKVRMIA